MSSSASVTVRAVARRLADRARELVLEGAMVVEVGQAVAAGALEGRAVESADAAAAEHVEQRQRDQQAQQHEQPRLSRNAATPERSASASRYSANRTSRPSSRMRRDVGVAVRCRGTPATGLSVLATRSAAGRPQVADLAGDR